MKNTMLILLMCSSFAVEAQRWGRELNAQYLYAKPLGPMGSIIDQGHGFGTNFGFVTPDSKLAFGVDLGFAQYGRDKSRQEYTFEDGSVAPMDVIVSNTFINAVAYSRYYLSTAGLVQPYLTGKLGYSAFSTHLNIYDPDDNDHCEPVDDDVLHRDGTFIASIGAGAKVDFATIFKRMQKGRFHFDASVSFIQGGEVRYMNADAPHTQHQHNSSPDADVVTAGFLNTQTQIVHEHHVGYLYSSVLQMTDLRVGVTMNILR
jgi:hypothetical protein